MRERSSSLSAQIPSLLHLFPLLHASLVWKSITKAFTQLHHLHMIANRNASLWNDPWMEKGLLGSLFVIISDADLRVRDVWRDGSWDFSRLSTNIPELIKFNVMAIPVPTFLALVMLLCGQLARMTTLNRLSNRMRDLQHHENWNWVWKLAAPEKIRMFF